MSVAVEEKEPEEKKPEDAQMPGTTSPRVPRSNTLDDEYVIIENKSAAKTEGSTYEPGWCLAWNPILGLAWGEGRGRKGYKHEQSQRKCRCDWLHHLEPAQQGCGLQRERYKTVDVVTEGNDFMWECHQLATFPSYSLEIRLRKAQFWGFLKNVNNKVWIISIFVRLQNY